MKSTVANPLGDPAFRAALLTHYDAHARSLPWRGETDPYRVLVSEVMLQQTRVETVKRYYGPWLERFPTVEALAAAPEDEVLKAWEGLGYYRRARNLRGAAVAVRERAGLFPESVAGLRELPGVGEYTAGAVASIAFGVATPAVDGNVRRVFARLFGEPEPSPKWLRERAAPLVDETRPGDWNQAVMELGATVCRPIGPRCESCPVSRWCVAFATGTQSDLPAPLKKAPVRAARISLAVLERDGSVLLTRRPADGLLGGMWAFPEEEPRDLARRLGLVPCGELTTLAEVAHRFTHLDATYVPLWQRCTGASVPSDAEGDEDDGGEVAEIGPTELRWVDAESVSDVALPVAQRRVFELWQEARGQV